MVNADVLAAYNAPSPLEVPSTVTSWAPVDVGALLDGDDGEVPPSILVRDDGEALVYRATVNALNGESESMKSWTGQYAVAQQLVAGHVAAYIDFESTGRKVVSRLLSLGVPADAIRSRFLYVSPREPLEGIAETDLASVLELEPVVVVIDGVTDAMGLHGLDLNSNPDCATFHRMLPRRIADTGAAVILIDHVTKSKDGRGRHAIGGQHKLSAIDGAAYTVSAVKPFGRGKHGVALLTVTKDRPGYVRGLADTTKVAELHLESDAVAGTVTASLRTAREVGEGGTFRPTVLMQRVSVWLEEQSEPASKSAIGDAVQGKGAAVAQAVDVLVDEGYVRRTSGERNAQLHTSIRPYREDDDRPPLPPS